jgi:hypothetical protein
MSPQNWEDISISKQCSTSHQQVNMLNPEHLFFFISKKIPLPSSSFILHPSSFIPHPSSLIPHPSSFILHPFKISPALFSNSNILQPL